MFELPKRPLLLLALSLVFPVAIGCTRAVRDPQLAEPLQPLPHRVPYQKQYVFNEDWFTHHTPRWGALLRPYRGKPGVQYLEVGIWEGRSLFWMLDNILTDPSSHATGIDILAHENFLENLERSGVAERTTFIKGFSQVALRKLPREHYDVIYIDGSHVAADVLEDMVLCWSLLKHGGVMIADDYEWDGSAIANGQPMPEDLLPRVAIDGFLSAYRNSVQVIYKKYQVALRRLSVPCPRGPWQCSRLGDYGYDWNERVFYRDRKPLDLTEEERGLVELLIESRTGDGQTIRLDPRTRRSAALAELDERLGLGLD